MPAANADYSLVAACLAIRSSWRDNRSNCDAIFSDHVHDTVAVNDELPICRILRKQRSAERIFCKLTCGDDKSRAQIVCARDGIAAHV